LRRGVCHVLAFAQNRHAFDSCQISNQPRGKTLIFCDLANRRGLSRAEFHETGTARPKKTAEFPDNRADRVQAVRTTV
jgi:hypothetical protein